MLSKLKTGSIFFKALVIGITLSMVSVGAIKLLDLPPAADAGPDIIAHPGELVILDGSDSQGDIAEYSWYMRDNSEVKNEAVIEHTFDKLGTYQVGLVVRAENYKMDLDYTTVDIVNEPPICNIMGTYQTVEDYGVVFQWDAYDEYSSKEDMKYIWKFGDGTSYETMNPDEEISHVYSNEGVYSVTLIVEDEFGAYSQDQTTVQVSNVEPVCDFTINYPYQSGGEIINEDELIHFDASTTLDTDSDLNTMDYHWDFGDGTQLSGKKVWHQYSVSGDYSVTLNVKDDDGKTDTKTRNITVSNPYPESIIDGDFSIEEGMTGIYTSVSKDNPSDRLFHKWSTGDEGRVTTNRWENSGGKSINLRVIDDDKAEDSVDEDVHVVNTDPHPFIYSGYIKADVRLRIAGEPGHDLDMVLYEDGEPIHTFYVERGTGEPQTDKVEDIVFDLSKTYTAKTVYTPEDDSDSGPNGANPAWIDIIFENGTFERINHTFNVVHKDTYWWNVTVNKMLKNHDIHFKARIFDQGEDDIKVTWGWGDGTVIENEYSSNGSPTLIDEEMVHRYEDDGEYTLTVTAEDEDGGIDIYEMEITQSSEGIYLDNFAPYVEAGDDLVVNEDEEFTLSGSALDNQEDLIFSWNTGQTGESVVTSFGHQGEYLVVLNVTDSHGDSGYGYTFVDVVNLCPYGMESDDILVWEDEVNIFNGSDIKDTSSDEVTYFWEFGDGANGYGVEPDKTYAEKGLYEVSVIAVDDNNCTFVDEFDVTVKNVDPVINLNDFKFYEDQTVSISAEGCYDTISDIDKLEYKWISPKYEEFHTKTFTYNFKQKGNYPFTLFVSDGDSTIQKTFNIHVLNPSPTISISNYRLYGEKMNYKFTASVYDNPSDTLRYTWNWGDGSNSNTNLPEAYHEYQSSDVFTLTLNVDDGDGIYSSTCKVYVGVDEDRDGLTDEVENNIGTSKSNPDTDGDFLLDYFESNQYYQTDPTKEDSDDDGMLDWYELSYFGPEVDLDNDGLVCQLDWDSDGDLISDGREESEDLNPKIYNDPILEEATYDGIKVLESERLSVIVNPNRINDGNGQNTLDVQIEIDIMENVPEDLPGKVTPYYQISASSDIDKGLIKKQIDIGSVSDFSSLRWYKLTDDGWKVLYGGLNTCGPNNTYQYVWAQVDSFSILSVADVEEGENDADGDGLTDAEETGEGAQYWDQVDPYHTPFIIRPEDVQTNNADIYIRMRKTVEQSRIVSLELQDNVGDYEVIWRYSLANKYKWYTTRGVVAFTASLGIKFSGSPDIEIDKVYIGPHPSDTPPTDPNNPDCDYDGLSDGEEININTYEQVDFESSNSFRVIGEETEMMMLNSIGPIGWPQKGEISFTINTEDFTAEGPDPPATPENLNLENTGSNNVRISWDKSERATHYNISRSDDGGSSYTELVDGVTKTKFVDSSVSPSTEYYYKVKAYNVNSKKESAESIAICITTNPPPDNPPEYKPPNFHGGYLFITEEVILSWESVDNTRNYRVQSDIGGRWGTIDNINDGGESVFISTLHLTVNQQVTYNFRVRAENWDGNGPWAYTSVLIQPIFVEPLSIPGESITSGGTDKMIISAQQTTDPMILDKKLDIGSWEMGENKEETATKEFRGWYLTHLHYTRNWNLYVRDNDENDEAIISNYKLTVWRYLNPLCADSDGDGLDDGKEVNGWDSMVSGQAKHFIGDPFDATDRDGDEEDDLGEWYLRTDPSNDDTDDDGCLDSYDVNPLVDLKVTVNVKEWNQIDEVDGFPGFYNDGDFYVVVDIGGFSDVSSYPGEGHNKAHEYPDWESTWNVPDDWSSQSVDISIELVDDDNGGSISDTMDISGNGKKSDITYFTTDGTWYGDDSTEELDGAGHVSGNEDGSTGTDEYDCELWFDVLMNDNDGDGVPYRYEIRHGMNPVVNDGQEDLDEDGMSNWYEWKYGLDPNDAEDAEMDLDGDGLLNVWEYELGERNPRDSRNVYKISLTVSLEWDADDEYIDQLMDGFRGASLYMMTVTDGYCYISDVTIYNDKQNWDNVNIRIGDQNATNPEDEWWPSAIINGYWDGIGWGWFSDEIKLPRQLLGNNPDTGFYYDTIVHELGHYVFGFYDEYSDSDDEDELDNTLMDNNDFYYMSYKKLYDDNGNPDTEQMNERGMSCWEWFFDHMGNDKVLIDFDEEAREDDYIPYGAYEDEGIGVKDVNYDFSEESCGNGRDYCTILESLDEDPNKKLPNMDITSEMTLMEG